MNLKFDDPRHAPSLGYVQQFQGIHQFCDPSDLSMFGSFHGLCSQSGKCGFPLFWLLIFFCLILHIFLSLEEERKTLKSTLDVDLNLSQHLMSTSQVNISCQHLMSIFQLDFPFLMPSISQYLEFNIYDCYFWVGFPVSDVKYFSKFGILHLRLHFWVGFPISAVKYFSKLKFCIYDWTFGVDLDENEDEDD